MPLVRQPSAGATVVPPRTAAFSKDGALQKASQFYHVYTTDVPIIIITTTATASK